MGMTTSPALHPDLAPLAFLLGSWSGTGHGQYPTIADFSYQETVTYTHVGKPFIVYTQRTQDPHTGAPMHTESGYLRPVGPAVAEMVLSQPSGIVEVHHVAIDGPSIEMVSTTVVRTPTAKPVSAVRRIVTVDGPVMRYTMDMAAMGLELQFHLSAELSWG